MSFDSHHTLSKRMAAIFILGFSSGLPLALTSSTLQAWFSQLHINLMTIGALSLLGIPYTFKFLWAPLMDYVGFSHLGKRKTWIMIMQLGVVVSLLILAQLNPLTQHAWIGVVAFIVAFFSASQDVSVNAYTTDVLSVQERGFGAAFTVLGYRIGMLISGGLALIFADYIGWRATYELMAFMMACAMLMTYYAPKPVEVVVPARTLFETIYAAAADLLQRDKILLILSLIFFYKFGDALALQLITNFLLNGLGFSLTEVGVANKFVGITAMILGGLVGGAVLTRWNIYYAMLAFGIAQAVSNLMFAVLAIVGKQFLFMSTAIFIENFCSGLSSAALLAFMMSLCDHRYTASQFALLSAFASLGRVFFGPVASVMVIYMGWVQFFVWSFFLCLPGITLLLLLKNEVGLYARAS